MGKLDPGLLHPLVHRSEEGLAHRALLRSREALVTSRARLIIHTRSLVKPFGARLPRCSTDAFASKVLDQRIEALARDTYPQTALLGQVPGVGHLTALAFVLTVEDPTRFRRARSMGFYLGLRPRQDEYGTLKPQLPITKAGDRMLRHLLVECSQRMLLSRAADTDLRRWGLKIAERGGKAGRKHAAVAVARKLSVLLLRLWVTGEVYEPSATPRSTGNFFLPPPNQTAQEVIKADSTSA